ncbi:MAG: hypothetical protein ACRELV_02820, partial [Longimicrobiales bacterium]
MFQVATPAQMVPEVAVAAYDGTGEDWDAFVRGEERAGFCHLSAWRSVMADALGHEPLYLVALDRDGEWLGVLPAVRVRSRVFGTSVVSMPFLNYGGPVGRSSAERPLIARAVGMA